MSARSNYTTRAVAAAAGQLSKVSARNLLAHVTSHPAAATQLIQQLAENDIRLLHEQDELEKKQVELFGIRPASQRGPDESAEAIWLAAPALERLVEAGLVPGAVLREERRLRHRRMAGAQDRVQVAVEQLRAGDEAATFCSSTTFQLTNSSMSG